MHAYGTPFDWTEKELEEFLTRNLDLIEHGLELHEQQFHLPSETGPRGFIDLLCRDRFGNFVIVEIKRSASASRNAASEILHYVTQFCLNHGQRTSRIRCFVVSTVWDQMLLPLSKLQKCTDFPICGIHILLSAEKKVLKNEKVEWVDVEAVPDLRFFPVFSVDLYKTTEDRECHIQLALERLKILGISNYVILTFDKKNLNLLYSHGLCIAITDDNLHDEDFIDMQLRKIANEEDYIYESVRHRLIDYLTMNDDSIDREVHYGTPDKICGLLGNWEPSTFAIGANLQNKLSIFNATDIFYELAQVEHGNKTTFVRIIGTDHPSQLRETSESIMKLGASYPVWGDMMLYLLEEYSSKPGNIAIRMFLPNDFCTGLARLFQRGDMRSLPFADMIQFGGAVLRRSQGVLEWDKRPMGKRRSLALLEMLDKIGTMRINASLTFSQAAYILGTIGVSFAFYEEVLDDGQRTVFKLLVRDGRISREIANDFPSTIADALRIHSDFRQRVTTGAFKNYHFLDGGD